MKRSENPLLSISTNPFEAPAFDKIKTEHYLPAFKASIAKGMAEIDSIANNPNKPTFENSVEALEYAGRELSTVSAIFFNLDHCATNPEMQQIALEISHTVTEFHNSIILNDKLFKRIKSVYRSRKKLNLNREDSRLLAEYYRSFTKNGANLSLTDKKKLGKIDNELSAKSLQFGQNLLAATNHYHLHITEEADLLGMPEFIKKSAEEEAKSQNQAGWLFTLHAPSYTPFMQYCSVRDLRKQMWIAYNTRAFNDNYDNQSIIKRLVQLRLRKANLLGYETYSDYVLTDNMAKTRYTVNHFLNNLLKITLPYANKEIEEIQKYANNHGLSGELMPWDLSYYSEKYRDELFALNEEQLKPFFQLENVQQAIFSLANTLYGLNFIKRVDVPTYHPDVKVFEVRDEFNKFMALLYLDFFPRKNKSGGAWMTTFRKTHNYKGEEKRPFVQIVCNFTKPTETIPSLLTFREVVTFLHEFGHALHSILSEGKHPSLTGTSVSRDFVEFPSQIMENWATEKEFLKSFAKHYITGEQIPEELINKIIASRNFLSGYSQVRQLSFGICDMAWHSLKTIPRNRSIEQFEKEAIRETALLTSIDSTSLSTSFGHIFAGGYAAGYYSYKWSEVLEADAFSLFKEKGIFNRDVANSFRDNVLSKGKYEDPALLFRRFRGRNPNPKALLQKFGFRNQQHK